MHISTEFLKLLGICALLALVVPPLAYLLLSGWEIKAVEKWLRERFAPGRTIMAKDSDETPSFGWWLYVLLVAIGTLIIGTILVSRMNVSDKNLDVPQTPFHRFPPTQ